MGNAKAIVAAFMLLACIVLMLFPSAPEKVLEGVIVDPRDNPRTMGLLEKACAGSNQCYANHGDWGR